LCQLLIDQKKIAFTCFVACSVSRSDPQSTCPTGFTCIPVEGDFANKNPANGACYVLGKAARDAACLRGDLSSEISTGCASPEDACVFEPLLKGSFCRKMCDRSSTTPGCEVGQACSIRNLCQPVSQIAQVTIGGVCDPNPDTMVESCGTAKNGVVTGYCDPDDQRCHQVCDITIGPRGGCPPGQTCHLLKDETIQFGQCS
jgi:hypothetical protein